jgi:hypothetical protein
MDQYRHTYNQLVNEVVQFANKPVLQSMEKSDNHYAFIILICIFLFIAVFKYAM